MKVRKVPHSIRDQNYKGMINEYTEAPGSQVGLLRSPNPLLADSAGECSSFPPHNPWDGQIEPRIQYLGHTYTKKWFAA